MVRTADGYKAIAHIQLETASFPRTRQAGKQDTNPVTARYGNPYQETVYIKVSDGIGNSQTLISNRIHPFYSDGKWIKAEDLKAGTGCLPKAAKPKPSATSLSNQNRSKPTNLTVADWHTYFVKGDKAETEGFGFIMIVRMAVQII
nr:polymorphic toxin-type HINT domain-containing protein [Neisseria gonorrhoeae]